jgi:hypothetical protein
LEVDVLQGILQKLDLSRDSVALAHETEILELGTAVA